MNWLPEDAARALAKTLNWEPPNHDDYPGSIPDHAWEAWRAFEGIAARSIQWRKVDATSWRKAHDADWSPDFEAASEGEHLLLIQHDWHGFPDPPEWALHVMDGGEKVARCLGCFDTWPETWSS
ncbi:MAG: hypothetical protein Q8R02_10835 [Hyphomonadaceae bacterium]|nr:hypothetical protein [Hyphomonadaceae bacterium]